MNKYVPQKDMTILIKTPSKNMFGIITNIFNTQMTILRLDECGKITIDIHSDWEPVDILDPKILHTFYDTFIGKNVTNIFMDNYGVYKKKYIKID